MAYPKNTNTKIATAYRKTETKNQFEIDPKCAHDITWVTIAKLMVDYIKEAAPPAHS